MYCFVFIILMAICICLYNVYVSGKFCDQKIKPCSSNPCKNHGTCIEYDAGYQCMCQVTFAGLHCEYMSKLVEIGHLCRL